MSRQEANFEITQETDSVIVIRDLGPWDRFMTVTNAAEWVVESLHAQGRLAGRRLFYYDSDGDLGELLVRNGEFAGFWHADRAAIR